MFGVYAVFKLYEAADKNRSVLMAMPEPIELRTKAVQHTNAHLACIRKVV